MEVWTLLKTLLFTSIRVVQSVLSVVLFVAPPSALNDATAFTVTLDTLHILAHLAFVLPRFGGVSSTGESGFPELKKAFYTALDVLSSDASESSRFIRETRNELLGVQHSAQGNAACALAYNLLMSWLQPYQDSSWTPNDLTHWHAQSNSSLYSVKSQYRKTSTQYVNRTLSVVP